MRKQSCATTSLPLHYLHHPSWKYRCRGWLRISPPWLAHKLWAV